MSELEELERAQQISSEKVRAQKETIDQQNVQIDSLTGRLQKLSDMMVHRVICVSAHACAYMCMVGHLLYVHACVFVRVLFMCMHVCLCTYWMLQSEASMHAFVY
jgi:uncharacterized coiled-coil protein SlyX